MACRLRPLVYQEAPGEVLKLVESQVNVTAQLLSSLAAAAEGARAEGSNALLVPLELDHRKERQASLQDLFEQAQALHESGRRHILHQSIPFAASAMFHLPRCLDWHMPAHKTLASR